MDGLTLVYALSLALIFFAIVTGNVALVLYVALGIMAISIVYAFAP